MMVAQRRSDWTKNPSAISVLPPVSCSGQMVCLLYPYSLRQCHQLWYLHQALSLHWRAGSSTQAPVSWVNPLGIYDRGTSLWLEGKGQPEVKGDKQDVEAQGSSSTLLSARVEEFNRKLRENPTDTQLWLDFVHFQVKPPEKKGANFVVSLPNLNCSLALSLIRMNWPLVLGHSLLPVTLTVMERWRRCLFVPCWKRSCPLWTGQWKITLPTWTWNWRNSVCARNYGSLPPCRKSGRN